MKTIEKIEAKGYSVTNNIGWQNGEQRIVSVTAQRGSVKINAKNVTELYNRVKDSR